MAHAPLSARIQIKETGPQSFTSNGRTLLKGSSIISANPAEIRHYMSCGCVEITILSGSLDARAASTKAPEPVEQADEAAPDSEEQEGGTEAADESEEPAEGEPEASEGEEPAEETTEGEPTALPSYARAELEVLNKSQLIQRAQADGLPAMGVKINLSMTKTAIIDAMMAAVTPAEE